MLDFTWWVNRKDSEGRNVFQGGFLGLDNIGVFDRSAPLPTGGHIDQADGTSWMAMYSLNLMRIALELARHNHVYEDIATKFFEHFLHIAEAMNRIGGDGIGLWDEKDEFYYDVLHLPDGGMHPLKVRSMVGLIPLFAVETLEASLLEEVPEFHARLRWFLEHRPDLTQLVSRWQEPGMGERRLLSLLRGHRMKCLLRRMLDETEFLSDYGVRAISRHHLHEPYEFHVGGQRLEVRYQPAESESGLFGGNSNWRGPIWMPLNYLLIESLEKFHHYYGDDFRVECPTGSGVFLSVGEVAAELGRRLSRIFSEGQRWETGCLRVFGEDGDRSSFSGLCALSRVFRRRHGTRRWRFSPNRMDRANRQAAASAQEKRRRTALTLARIRCKVSVCGYWPESFFVLRCCRRRTRSATSRDHGCSARRKAR